MPPSQYLPFTERVSSLGGIRDRVICSRYNFAYENMMRHLILGLMNKFVHLVRYSVDNNDVLAFERWKDHSSKTRYLHSLVTVG